MSDPNRVYGVRYYVEHWGKPREGVGKKVVDGISVSVNNHGYTDELFLASILNKKDGGKSVLLMDSVNGIEPSREMLELVRDHISHHLEHHTE